MTGIAALLVVVFIGSVSASCPWPKEWQKKAFFNDAADAVFRPVSASEIQVVGGDTLECVIRSGSFILRRAKGTNKYKCLKIIDVCDHAFVVHETEEVTSSYIPDFCELCGPAHITVGPEVWVAKEKTVRECTVPHTCPGGNGKKCTGCESTTPDEGVCVAKHELRKNYYDTHDHYYDDNQKSYATKHGSVHTHYKDPHHKKHATKHGSVHTHYKDPHHKRHATKHGSVHTHY